MSNQWRHEALCQEVDIYIFHPDNDHESKMARRVCAKCDVKEPCLAEVLAKDEHSDDNMYGIRGGMVPRARRQLIRSIRLAKEASQEKQGM